MKSSIKKILKKLSKAKLMDLTIGALTDSWVKEMVESGLLRDLKENANVVVTKEEFYLDKLKEWKRQC